MGVTNALFTINEACTTLKVGRTTIYHLIRTKRIGVVRIGTRGVRIPLVEIDRFIREGLGQEASHG